MWLNLQPTGQNQNPSNLCQVAVVDCICERFSSGGRAIPVNPYSVISGHLQNVGGKGNFEAIDGNNAKDLLGTVALRAKN